MANGKGDEIHQGYHLKMFNDPAADKDTLGKKGENSSDDDFENY